MLAAINEAGHIFNR